MQLGAPEHKEHLPIAIARGIETRLKNDALTADNSRICETLRAATSADGRLALSPHIFDVRYLFYINPSSFARRYISSSVTTKVLRSVPAGCTTNRETPIRDSKQRRSNSPEFTTSLFFLFS
ncbi:hypothetical protein EVAR_10145_1 [Eumeta japonica]|uniref:Uncharacterized protein n=1 Tax=Eumeta variegata TaxID=151549 RepID=A0A4C1UDP4_EUMVA|nr:hypothetical protein EVAR_10145_1 [Eumeta japonica]